MKKTEVAEDRNWLLAVILIGLIGASLSGCGQKKSLYLPDKQATSEQRKADNEDQSAEAGKSSY